MFFFKQNAELENLDNVPAEYKLFYVAGQDGKFRIKDDLKAVTDNIDGLRTNLTTAQSNLTRANTESAERRTQLEAITGLNIGANAEEIKTKFDQMTKDLTEGKKINPDTIRAEITSQFQGKLDEATNSSKALETELHEVLVDDAITRGIIAEKGNVALLSPVAKSKIGVVKDPNTGKRIAVGVNEKGEALPGVDGGFMPVSKVIESLKSNKDFSAAFEGTNQSGAGGPVRQPQRGYNPSPVGAGGRGPGEQGQRQRSPQDKISAGLQARQQGAGR